MVGGYAAQIHGSTRVTTDVDVTPERSAAQVVVDGLELVSEIGLPHPAPVTRIRDRAARFPTAVASGLRGVGSSRRPQRAQRGDSAGIIPTGSAARKALSADGVV